MIDLVVMVVVYVVGAVMGYILAKGLSRPKTIGTIRIDRSDDDGPYMFLELDEPVSAFSNEKHVCVEIKNEDFLPRN